MKHLLSLIALCALCLPVFGQGKQKIGSGIITDTAWANGSLRVDFTLKLLQYANGDSSVLAVDANGKAYNMRKPLAVADSGTRYVTPTRLATAIAAIPAPPTYTASNGVQKVGNDFRGDTSLLATKNFVQQQIAGIPAPTTPNLQQVLAAGNDAGDQDINGVRQIEVLSENGGAIYLNTAVTGTYNQFFKEAGGPIALQSDVDTAAAASIARDELRFKNGGNAFPDTAKLGTTTAVPLAIATNDQTRVLIQANGFIGLYTRLGISSITDRGATSVDDGALIFNSASKYAAFIRAKTDAMPTLVVQNQATGGTGKTVAFITPDNDTVSGNRNGTMSYSRNLGSSFTALTLVTKGYTDSSTAAIAATITPAPVSSVFGRTGAITAQSGDYTTSQVPESGNLYYTDARARASNVAGYATTYNSTTGAFSVDSNVIPKLGGAALGTGQSIGTNDVNTFALKGNNVARLTVGTTNATAVTIGSTGTPGSALTMAYNGTNAPSIIVTDGTTSTTAWMATPTTMQFNANSFTWATANAATGLARLNASGELLVNTLTDAGVFNLQVAGPSRLAGNTTIISGTTSATIPAISVTNSGGTVLLKVMSNGQAVIAAPPEYADDAAANAAGRYQNSLYRTGSFIKTCIACTAIAP